MGFWHLPILPPSKSHGAALVVVLSVAVVHSLIGVLPVTALAKSGNLAVPAFTHALIDGVRDGLRITV